MHFVVVPRVVVPRVVVVVVVDLVALALEWQSLVQVLQAPLYE
jgi:hypothetical protein